MRILGTIFLIISFSFNTFAQEKTKSFLITNVIIHTSEGIIENGVIGVVGDVFTLVGDSKLVKYDSNQFEDKINANGAHAWPGFIALNSTIGLREIDAVRATRDFAEVGLIKPHVRSLTAFNTDSKIIPTVRSNGVLLVQSTPKGGWVTGTSSTFKMSGWNWEDAVVLEDDGIHINWPTADAINKEKKEKEEDLSHENRRMLKKLFDDAKAYDRETSKEKNLILEALQPVLNGSATLFIHANKSRDIQDAVLFKKEYDIQKFAIVGCDECESHISDLKKNDVQIVLSRLHRLPYKPDIAPEAIFELPAKLVKAGLTVSLCYSGDMEAMGTRNLPFTAGTAAAYGLSDAEALNLISLNAAKIVGLDSSYGSIEQGKKAVFFLGKENALDMRTAGADRIWIHGVEVDSGNRQKELYEKYKAKYDIE